MDSGVVLSRVKLDKMNAEWNGGGLVVVKVSS